MPIEITCFLCSVIIGLINLILYPIVFFVALPFALWQKATLVDIFIYPFALTAIFYVYLKQSILRIIKDRRKKALKSCISFFTHIESSFLTVLWTPLYLFIRTVQIMAVLFFIFTAFFTNVFLAPFYIYKCFCSQRSCSGEEAILEHNQIKKYLTSLEKIILNAGSEGGMIAALYEFLVINKNDGASDWDRFKYPELIDNTEQNGGSEGFLKRFFIVKIFKIFVARCKISTSYVLKLLSLDRKIVPIRIYDGIYKKLVAINRIISDEANKRIKKITVHENKVEKEEVRGELTISIARGFRGAGSNKSSFSPLFSHSWFN